MMLTKLKTGLLAVIALLACAFAPLTAVQAAEATAKPALWVIKDADSTIYFLGSVHVMRPQTEWLSPAIASRFDSAQEVWFEIPDLDDKAAALPLAQAYMFDPTGTMTDGLTPEEIAQLDALLKPLGMNSQMLKPMRKWAVGLVVVLQQAAAMGYDTETGVDLTLLARARATGKTVYGFETMKQQLESLVPSSPEEELAGLRLVLKDSASMPQDLDDLFTAWSSGDTDALSQLMIVKMKNEDPQGYQRLLVDRNAAWVPQIEEILAGKGTVFVTVGAAHLVGPDSVFEMLAAKGIKAERVVY